MEKEYSVRISVTNNLLSSACKRNNVSFKDVSDATGVNYNIIIAMSGFKLALIDKYGQINKNWKIVADFLGESPFDLVPERFWDSKPKKTSSKIKCNEEGLRNYSSFLGTRNPLLQLEDSTNISKIAHDLIGVSNLTAREIDILKRRFVNDETYDEICKQYKVTTERARQIEIRAIKKLKTKAFREKIKIRDVF